MTTELQPTRYEKGFAIPPQLGLAADELKHVEDIAKQMQRETDRVKERVSELRQHLIVELGRMAEAGGDTGAVGRNYRVTLKTNRKPKIEADTGWDKFYSYVQANARFDLLQKRLSEKAITDLVDDGVQVPGIEFINLPDLSITKK